MAQTSIERDLSPEQVYEGASEIVRGHLVRKESSENLFKLGEKILANSPTIGELGDTDAFSTQISINGQSSTAS